MHARTQDELVVHHESQIKSKLIVSARLYFLFVFAIQFGYVLLGDKRAVNGSDTNLGDKWKIF